ncbi:ABC transporter permease subunit [Actinokineospora sp. PR83]|uniref:ABC transporter permease subunit n=1 Tax=Actinokineospora sp. PR83 TaxID=2884908 RepID=UPI001F22CD66|nr:ABC transporter permease subunit [Actinokineospora sp. PR83]MCG8917496.1 ABC transporter permease subunit [Actinokineospora sp. PR83]
MRTELTRLPALLRLALRRTRANTAAWTLGVFLLSALQLSAYPAVRAVAADLVRLMDNYPPALRTLFDIGGDFATGPGYLRAELFSLTVPLMLIGLAVSQASAATAVDERGGTLEFLLANPISRTALLAAKGLAVLLNLLLCAAVLAVTVLTGSLLADLDVGVGGVLGAVAVSTLIAAVFGAVALAVGAATGRRGAATAVGTGLALLTFLVSSLGERVGWLHPWRVLSPFTAAPGAALTDGFPVLGAVLIATASVAATVAAAVVFARRDLHT